MDFVFDLQLFADEEEATVEVEVEEQKEEPKEEPKAEEPKEEETEVPEELDGLDLSQEEVKEILKEAAPEKEEEPPKTDADADSDNKQVPPAEEAPQQNIPYARFKAELDKRHAADEEIERLKKELEQAKAVKPQQPPTPPVQPPPPPPAEMPTFSPELARQIDEAVNKQAMKMTGMTQEDVEALDYADESDAKAKTYRYAKDLARASIIGNIQQNAMRQQQQAAIIMENQQKLVNEFNQFYQEQVAQPDYNDTVQFATNEFFERQEPSVQFAVSDAYTRVQRNIASPQDILVVKNYFTEAQKAFRAKAAPAEPKPQPQQQNKPNLPRTNEVSGSATSPKETVTVASLQKLIEENRFEDIPEKYQKLLLGE